MKSARTLRWLMQQGGGFNPLGIPNLLFFNSYKTVTPTDAIVNAAGTKTITGAAPAMVISIAGSGVTVAHPGSTAICSGFTIPANNGSFTITNASANSNITIDNPAGVAQVGNVGARVDIVGLCSSATDLVAGRVFAQATLNDKWAVNTSLIPGKRVLCTGLASIMGRFMTVVDAALAGALNGVQPFTMFIYIYPVLFNAQVSFSNWITFEDATSVSRAAARVGGNNNHRVATVNAAGVLSEAIVNHAALATNAWQLWAVTHDGATARFYLNGVLAGSIANVPQTRTALTRVVLSNRATGMTGLVGTRHFRAVEGAASGLMSTADQLSLRTYCQAEYA